MTTDVELQNLKIKCAAADADEKKFISELWDVRREADAAAEQIGIVSEMINEWAKQPAQFTLPDANLDGKNMQQSLAQIRALLAAVRSR